jgi:uncharacterized protein with GYD domain
VAKYLMRVSYTAEGTKGLLKVGGSNRRQEVERLMKQAGGSLEAIYWAFGEDDVFAIADVPDNVTAAALALSIASTGAVSVTTTVLLTAEEIDEATKKQVDYRPPGS